MYNVNIFIRKKSLSNHHSIERFANTLKAIKYNKKFKINILKCPVSSKGFFRRLYLVFWSYLNQGDVNHVLGDVNFISIFMDKNKTINTFLDCRLLDKFAGLKLIVYQYLWFKIPTNISKKITYISNFTKTSIERKLKIKVKNSEVIPVPLVENLKFQVNKNKKKKILIVGTSENKNIKNMILSLKSLDISLTIIGKIKKDIKNLCETNNINYKNLVDISNNKMRNIYANNDILLMVSKYEGFGMPIIEAQSSGTVVITSNIEPMKSIVGDKGLTVNPNRPDEIRAKIKKLINSSNYFFKNVKIGKLNSIKYNSKKINKIYFKLYSEILKNEN